MRDDADEDLRQLWVNIPAPAEAISPKSME